jgi:putative flippase GtrA
LPYYIGTAVGAAVATTLHYAAVRRWVFPASRQTLIGGYERFVVIAFVVVVCITGGTILLVSGLGVNVYIARVLVSVVAAIGSFFVNGRYNFHAL